jgi:hypothetical protein
MALYAFFIVSILPKELITLQRAFLEKLVIVYLLNRSPVLWNWKVRYCTSRSPLLVLTPNFSMELEGSLLCVQKLTACPYAELFYGIGRFVTVRPEAHCLSLRRTFLFSLNLVAYFHLYIIPSLHTISCAASSCLCHWGRIVLSQPQILQHCSYSLLSLLLLLIHNNGSSVACTSEVHRSRSHITTDGHSASHS